MEDTESLIKKIHDLVDQKLTPNEIEVLDMIIKNLILETEIVQIRKITASF
jgi:hypothetical protein